MKKGMMIALLLTLLLSLCGCSGAESMQFYVIPEGVIRGGESDAQLLRLAKEEGRLAFTEEQIEGYLWTDHEIRLKERPILGSASDGGSRIFRAESGDCFLLVLDSAVLYRGGFMPSSGDATVQDGPYITDTSFQSFRIAFSSKYSEGEDPRGDQQLYDYLVDHQLLSSKLNEN